MKRYITYLYAYEDKVKKKNIGYLKITIKDVKVRIEITINNLGQYKGTGEIFFLTQKDRMYGIFMGKMDIARGKGGFGIECDMEDINQSGFNFQDIEGVRIECMENGFLASCWEEEFADRISDDYIIVDKNSKKSPQTSEDNKLPYQPPRQSSQQSVQNTLQKAMENLTGMTNPKSSQQSNQQPTQNIAQNTLQKAMENFANKANSNENQNQILTHISDKVTNQQSVTNQLNKINQPNITNQPNKINQPNITNQPNIINQQNTTPQPNIINQQNTTPQSNTINQQSIKTQQNITSQYKATTQQKLQQNSVNIQNTTASEPAMPENSVKIDVSKIKLFPKKNWYLCNNSFLLHGYLVYHYLIVKNVPDSDNPKEITKYIGVPGVGDKQERIMAMIFGFYDFEEVTHMPNGQSFGYWYIKLET
ncbi:MAG: hypothetical protein UH963_14720 [Agathobacter sp.]|nr:hypothetical protein [Agathobacter sp.]